MSQITLKNDTKKALKKIISLLSKKIYKKKELITQIDLPQLIMHKTCLKELTAETSEGLFSFDIFDTAVGWRIATEGVWEEIETNFIKTIVNQGDVVVDVGANLGWYTIILANLVGKHGSVFAFEPAPNNYKFLLKNIQINNVNSQVKTYQTALLDSNSTVDFELSKENFGDHRIRFNFFNFNEPEKNNESYRKVITIKAITMNKALEEIITDRKIKLIKIDCQGSEIPILKGAEKILKNTEYLIVEYWPYGINRTGFRTDELEKILVENFSSFSRLRKVDQINFKSVSELRSDMASVSHFTDYVLKK